MNCACWVRKGGGGEKGRENVFINFKTNKIDLEDFGAMIAKEPVQRPEEPDDYLFKMDDNESIMTTGVYHIVF